MARRKNTRRTPASSDLVPALRDAVALVDRALEELGAPPAARKRKPAKSSKKR